MQRGFRVFSDRMEGGHWMGDILGMRLFKNNPLKREKWSSCLITLEQNVIYAYEITYSFDLFVPNLHTLCAYFE